jgi:hypothetical protein
MSKASNGNKKEHIRCPAKIMEECSIYERIFIDKGKRDPKIKKRFFGKMNRPGQFGLYLFS